MAFLPFKMPFAKVSRFTVTRRSQLNTIRVQEPVSGRLAQEIRLGSVHPEVILRPLVHPFTVKAEKVFTKSLFHAVKRDRQ